jgi:hypothetical protein
MIASTGSSRSRSSTSWHHTSARSPSRRRASSTMSCDASIARTRPRGTIAHSASVTRPVLQPTSMTVASGAMPARRARTSAAHACCGWLDRSYVRASHGVATTAKRYRPQPRPARRAPVSDPKGERTSPGRGRQGRVLLVEHRSCLCQFFRQLETAGAAPDAALRACRLIAIAARLTSLATDHLGRHRRMAAPPCGTDARRASAQPGRPEVQHPAGGCIA